MIPILQTLSDKLGWYFLMCILVHEGTSGYSKHLKNIFDSGELVKEILFIPFWNILQQIA